MSNEPRVMKEIHEIRQNIYEKIKGLTPEDQVSYFNESTKDTIEKYGIKVGTPADNQLRKVM